MTSRRRFAFFVVLVSMLPVAAPAQAQSQSRPVTIFERDSGYNHVVVTDRGQLRVMNFRRRGVNHRETVLDKARPLRLVSEYTGLMMSSLAFVPNPRKVLMIGLGGGIVTRVMAHHYPQATFDNVDLDPVVVEAARRFFGFRPGPRMRVFVRDGRVFLRRSRDRYDIIILDAFRGGYIPFHLKTEEFLQLVRDHLAPDGVVVANLHRGTRLYDADRATYAAVFDQVYVFEGRTSTNVVLVATQGNTRLTQTQLQARARRLQNRHNFDFDLPTQIGFYRAKASYSRRARVLTDDHAPVGALNQQRP